MSKNLFFESMSHLGVLPKELPEQKTSEIENKDPAEIFLGAGKVFVDPEEAYKYLIALSKQELPSGYRNKVAKSFLNSSEEGQINSLYKDWKKYKEGILAKIGDFFTLLKTSDKHPTCKKYISFLFLNKSPKDIDTYAANKVDLTYFKFWVLFKFFSTQRRS